MPRRTLAELKASRIATACQLCATDARFLAVLNEAEEMLVEAGAFWGVYGRYRAQVQSSLIVWPREVASILRASLCNTPIRSRSMFWEFLGTGMGLQENLGSNGSCCGGSWLWGSSDLLDRGTLPTQSTISGTTSKLKLYCDLASDVAATHVFMGYDQNGNWIRSIQNGVMSDGEAINPSLTGALSTHLFTSITGVIKPVTNGVSRLYAFDTSTNAQSALAVYEYDVTSPAYRVSRLPMLDNFPSTQTPPVVEIVAKLDFVPMRNDSDFALIGNIPALKNLCMAILDAEKAEATARQSILSAGLAVSKQLLENELLHYAGPSEDRIEVTGIMGPGEQVLENLI